MDTALLGKRATQLIAAAVLIAGCGDGGSGGGPIIFNGENNRLNAYQEVAGEFRKQTVIENATLDPNGRDINGQICFDPRNPTHFIAGEDTGQPNPPAGWGYFELAGHRVGELSATQRGKLTPTYQEAASNPENYGCSFLSDGRLLTTDVGNQASGPGTGQLILWFPPFEGEEHRFCKLDVAIGTAGGIAVDEQDRIYVASARVDPGVFRYTGPFPTSDDASGGCGQTDATGAPLAAAVTKEKILSPDGNVATPNAVVLTSRGTFYVSSVINGLIAEYDSEGTFLRRILEPLPGETLPFPSTGTPLGLGIDRAGNVYYADIGIVIGPNGPGPGDGTGSVRRIRFADGSPLPPEKLTIEQLDFPDGIGVLAD